METAATVESSLPTFKRSDTKYRVIADGNLRLSFSKNLSVVSSDTKYRVIADGNLGQGVFCTTLCGLSDTKYRVIADGNTA